MITRKRLTALNGTREPLQSPSDPAAAGLKLAPLTNADTDNARPREDCNACYARRNQRNTHTTFFYVSKWFDHLRICQVAAQFPDPHPICHIRGY